MSADPVTMMIASAVVQGIGTYREIQAEKEQAAFRKYQYEQEMKMAALKGEMEANDRKEMMIAQKENNLAVMSGSGFSADSGSFQNIQHMTKKIADKDITTIRLNTAFGINKLSLQSQAEAAASKSKVFGGYVSIISTGLTTKAKVDKYKGTTAKNYDFTYDHLESDKS